MNVKNYLLSLIFLLATTTAWSSTDSTFVQPIEFVPTEEVSSNEEKNSFISENNKKKTDEESNIDQLEIAIQKEFNQQKQDFVSLPPPPNDNVSNDVGELFEDELELIQKARETIAKIQDLGSFVSKLGGETLQSFPVGISQEIGNSTFTLAVAGMKIFPGYSQLEVFLKVESPKLNTPLIFFSPDIKFTVEGGIVGGGSLGLLGNMSIDIVAEKSILLLKRGTVNNLGVFTGGTYVQIDCNGFKEFGLDAEVHFSRDWIKPIPPPVVPSPDTTNPPQDNSRVVGRFNTVIGGLDDILIDIDIDDFVVTGVEDIIWSIDDAIFDFSEVRHNQQLNWPIVIADGLDYTPNNSGDGWTGFYLKSVSVQLPERLTGQNPVTIGGQNIIIDEQGFTGKAFASSTPLLGINQGNADGWAFSVNYFEVAFMTSELKQIFFDGRINAPLFSKPNAEEGDTILTNEDALAYEAQITLDNQYTFSVMPMDTMAVNCWKAKATFYPNSELSLTYDDEGFTASATIFADIGIDGKMGKNSKVKIPPMHVDELFLSNKSPYFSPGNWDLPDTLSASFGTFAISITNPLIFSNNTGPKPMSGLDFGVSLSLDGQLAIEATGDFTILGELDLNGERHKWRPKKFKINELGVDGSFPGVEQLVGKIYFFDEENLNPNEDIEFTPSDGANYGSGFRGELSVTFKSIDVQVDAIAQFGEIGQGADAYKYFMVDALATFSPGIPIGVLEIQGFGGGVYRHMMRPSIDKAFGQLQEGNSSQIGASLSGIVYTPNQSVSLGLKLSTVLALPADPAPEGAETSNSFSANLSFGMEFGPTDCESNEDGTSSCVDGFGIIRVWFQGNGRFMAPIDLMQVPSFPTAGITPPTEEEEGDTTPNTSTPPANEASVSAFVMIDLNFREKTYDGRASVIVAMGEIIAGKAWAAIHIDKNADEWYIHVGTPETLNYLSVDIGISQAIFTSYFMMGNKNIPDVPPAPAKVGFAYEGSRGGNHTSGKGLIFGAAFEFDNNFSFLFLNGDIDGGVGFDVGIRNVAADCTTAPEIGFNGWYAKGQAWAYFIANLNAKIKIGPLEKTVDLLETHTGALIQLEGPNPMFVRAQVHASINVAGLINAEMAFKFEFGRNLDDSDIPSDCISQGGGFLAEDLTIIESLELPEGSTDSLGLVSTAVQPEINLNYKNRSEFEFYNEELSTNEKYMIKTEINVLVDGEPFEATNDGYSSFGSGYFVEWDAAKTFGKLKFDQYLPQNSEITIEAVGAIYKLTPGPYGIVNDSLGQPYYEIKTLTFTTGNNPQYIDPGMVMMSYPYEGEQYLLKDETTNGVIKLQSSTDISYLIEDSEIKIEFFDKETEVLVEEQGNVMLNTEETTISIEADSINADGDLVTYTQSINSPHQSFSFDIPIQSLDNQREYILQVVRYNAERTVLYEINFATSQYNTLAEKLASFEQVNDHYISLDETANGDKLIVTLEGTEPFDEIEWTPSFNHPDLYFEAVLDAQSPGWYKDEATIMSQHVYGQPTNLFTSAFYQYSHVQKAVEVFPKSGEDNQIEVHYTVPDVIFDDYMTILEEIQIWDSLFAASSWADMDNGQDSLQLFNQLSCELLHPGNEDCDSSDPLFNIDYYLVDSLGMDANSDEYDDAAESTINTLANHVSGILNSQQADGISSLCDLANFGQTTGHQYMDWNATPGSDVSSGNTDPNTGTGTETSTSPEVENGPAMPKAPIPLWVIEKNNAPEKVNLIPGDGEIDETLIPETWEELQDMYDNLPQWIIDLSCNGGGAYIKDLYSGTLYKIKTRYRIPTTDPIYDKIEIMKNGGNNNL